MSLFENKNSAEDIDPKPAKRRGIVTSLAIAAAVLVGGGTTFVSHQSTPEGSEPASAVEILPGCPVMYIYPSDGSTRKVIVPEQSNCTEENAGRVMEVRMNASNEPVVTEYHR